MWTQRPQFEAIVGIQKLKDAKSEADEDRKGLKQAQIQLQRNPTSAAHQQIEAQEYAKFRQTSYLAEIYLQQRSKATWIKLGDDRTRYFYSVIRHRKLKQATTQLKDSTGNWQTDAEVIAGLFINYYEQLLGRRAHTRVPALKSILRNGHVLTIEKHITLVRPFAEKEVKGAIFQIDGNKSPGPDGYGSGFYKAAWKIVGWDVTATVIEFFQNGHFLKQLNSTVIALIPKVEAPEEASQYRPISCCNVLYKCISKLICNRLKVVVNQLVADNQSAFVQERSMLHNVLICHDILRHYNRKISPR
ncbi:PREDICTED: uncharacterized protein LOC109226094 [Nicotiana attenuata]|uniref:uncharacterized protein LOC109226094 n=1 Tax=Nicotiana attenuata TaxID=49451 RepID=UPI000905A5C2|nr:PREDICTED: uncharacterized protein LOC109226094 [Nicotiana attenuata]